MWQQKINWERVRVTFVFSLFSTLYLSLGVFWFEFPTLNPDVEKFGPFKNISQKQLLLDSLPFIFASLSEKVINSSVLCVLNRNKFYDEKGAGFNSLWIKSKSPEAGAIGFKLKNQKGVVKEFYVRLNEIKCVPFEDQNFENDLTFEDRSVANLPTENTFAIPDTKRSKVFVWPGKILISIIFVVSFILFALMFSNVENLLRYFKYENET